MGGDAVDDEGCCWRRGMMMDLILSFSFLFVAVGIYWILFRFLRCLLLDFGSIQICMVGDEDGGMARGKEGFWSMSVCDWEMV